MDSQLIIMIALLAFITSLAGVGAYIDIITTDKVNSRRAYTSLVILLTMGIFVIIFSVYFVLCFLINLFI